MVGAALSAGPDHGKSVEAPRQLRDVFAEDNPGQRGPDHSEFSADLGGGLGFGIERLELAGGSPQEDENDGIGSGRPVAAWLS